jgi:hypothetical protein
MKRLTILMVILGGCGTIYDGYTPGHKCIHNPADPSAISCDIAGDDGVPTEPDSGPAPDPRDTTPDAAPPPPDAAPPTADAAPLPYPEVAVCLDPDASDESLGSCCVSVCAMYYGAADTGCVCFCKELVGVTDLGSCP